MEKLAKKPDAMAHSYSSIIWEAEAGDCVTTTTAKDKQNRKSVSEKPVSGV